MQRAARSEIKRQSVGYSPIILQEKLVDLVARSYLALLQVDLEAIDLSEELDLTGVDMMGIT